MLTVTVLGCDGSHQGRGGAASSYMVKDWESQTALLVDAGSGSYANYQRFFSLDELSAVFLSHSHPDHWSDIEGIAVSTKFTVGRALPLRLIAPAGLRKMVQHASGPAFEWEEVADGDKTGIGPMVLSFFATDHIEGTLAVRVDCGGVAVGYSADTGSAWSPTVLGDDLDLFICEATSSIPYEDQYKHLSGRQAGRMASAIRPKRLMITHHLPVDDADEILSEAEEAFGGPVIQASVGLGITLP